MNTRKKVQPATNEPAKEITRGDLETPGFEARDGDTLSVTYGGAKVSIEGTYSSVELDSAHYKRVLREGDDLTDSFDRIYLFIKKRAESHARPKLMSFADQIAAAGRRSKGN